MRPPETGARGPGARVILGIDPGLNATGYGVIAVSGQRLALVTAGEIRPPRGRPLPERLQHLHRALSELLKRQQPDAVILEMVFTHDDYVNTAALMAHARGVACLAAQQHGAALVEYPPARVKKALTGHGAATKDQVARMVVQWLGCANPGWSFDATDALALAIAHAHMAGSPHLSVRRRRTRQVPAALHGLLMAGRRQVGGQAARWGAK